MGTDVCMSVLSLFVVMCVVCCDVRSRACVCECDVVRTLYIVMMMMMIMMIVRMLVNVNSL